MSKDNVTMTNMKISTQPYKGARDFYPEDKAFQKWMFGKWRTVVEKYGYQEYDAPILEPTDLFLMKGSEEIVNEQTYTFTDRGDRSVTIRTEMTPSVSRMVAGRRQELSYPARWYSIPNLWRYERMQRGRLREFWQLNVDMFGVSSLSAELEMIQITDDLIQAFDAKRSSYVIKVNSRLLVNEILSGLAIEGEKQDSLIRLIDRVHKMPTTEFAQKLDEITDSQEISKAVVAILAVRKVDELPETVRKSKSATALSKLIADCTAFGIRNIEFDITLMRGFDYYTDIVFEAFDTHQDNNRAMLGGGRYDGLVGQFGVDPVPTIGFAIGDVVFADFLRTHKLVPAFSQTTKLTLLLEDETLEDKASLIARELREMGMNTSIDFSGKKLDKQIKSAVKSGVRFVLFVKSGEASNFTLKDLQSGKEEQHSLQRIVSIVADSRK